MGTWWLRLPNPVLSLASTLLIAAANPRYTRRLSFAAVYVFPGALVFFVLGLLALLRPHPEHAIGPWIWSALLFALGSAIVAGAVRSTTRAVEQRGATATAPATPPASPSPPP